MCKIFVFLFAIVLTSKANAQKPFITIWKTDNTGISSNAEVRFPTNDKLTIKWELQNDPTISGSTVVDSSVKTISLPKAGIYVLKAIPVQDNKISFFFNAGDDIIDDRAKLIEIRQWGDAKWKTMFRAFANCVNMDMTATDVPDLSEVETMERMFFACYNFIGNSSLNNWDVSAVKNMAHLFGSCYKFNQPIGNWNTSNVTDMTNMFGSANRFNQNIENWNVGKVRSMYNMFNGADNFNQNLKNWRVPSYCDLSYMLTYASSYKGGEIKKLEYKPVSDMQLTKSFNKKPFISVWKTDNKGESNSNEVIFNADCTEREFLVKWELKSDLKVKGETMLSKSNKVIIFPKPGIYILKAYFPIDHIAVNIAYDKELNKDRAKILFVTQWGDARWGNLAYAFYDCENLDIIAKDIPDLRNSRSLLWLFYGCSSLVYNESINNWNVSNVENFEGTFAKCIKFNQPLNLWNTSNAITMHTTFSGCSSFNQNINSWNVSKVNTMKFMLSECIKYNQPLNKWNVKNVQNIEYMFYNTSSFNQDLSNWQFNDLQESENAFVGATAYKGIRFKEVSLERERAVIAKRNQLQLKEELARKNEEERKKNEINAINKGNDCIQSIRIGMNLAAEKYDNWKRACTNEFENSISGSNVAFHTTELIVVLRRVKETVGLGICNSLASEERTRLRDLLDKKIKSFEEFESDYKIANKKPSIWEVLIGGLQIATGTYE